MIRVAVKSLSTRRLRTVLTAFAIVLGVAMVSGAYTLTDTMGAAADSLSKASYNGTDAVVTTKTAVERTIDDEAPPPPVAASCARARQGRAGSGLRRRQHQRRGPHHRQGRQGRGHRPLLRRRL